jgi:hypothetical protein
MVYEIRVRGRLGPQWVGWFDRLAITPGDYGDTVLIGLIPDQAALYGLLTKIRNLGLPLLSICQVQSGPDVQRRKELT